MLGDRIKQVRKEKGITQQELANILSVAKSTIGMWENNKREPDIETIKQIADVFDYPVAFLLNDTVKIGEEYHSDDIPEHCCPICGYNYIHLEDVILIDFYKSKKSSGYALKFWCEADHFFYIIIENYKGNNYMTYTDNKFHPIKPVTIKNEESIIEGKISKLDEYGRRAILDLLNTEHERCVLTHSSEDKSITRHINLKISKLPASAGTGLELAEENYETVSVKYSDVVAQADFAVRVSGDSMEPTYYDGDILLVENVPTQIGDIGVFVVDGDGYVKEYGGDRLVSHNEKYPDIMLKDYDCVMCSGRVIGVLEESDFE